MFFLCKLCFWMTVSVLLLQSDAVTGRRADPEARELSKIMGSARETISAASKICKDQRELCAAAPGILTMFGHRIAAGARRISLMQDAAGQTPDGGREDRPSSSRGTLTRSDLEPAWHEPGSKPSV